MNGFFKIIAIKCNGEKILTESYLLNNNFAEGRIEWKRENGNIFLIENYKNGKLHGEYKYFNKKNILEMEFNFYEGIKRGPFKLYYEDGKIKQQGYFEDDLTLNGIYKSYYSNGKIEIVGYYDKGKKIGKWMYFDIKGKIIKIENF
ncbi:MAG: hypothetical protein QXI16_04595 [Sulfolobaceae archaeon]